MSDRTGFSLVEVMVGFGVFSVVAVGLSVTAIFSLRMSHQNVLRSTAYAAAQGFLEQLKVVPEEAIEDALANPATVPLPTRSISFTGADSVVDEDDPLYLQDVNASSSGSNHKLIVVDLKGDGDDATEVSMEMWYDLAITPLTHAKGYLVELDFTYEMSGVRYSPRLHGRLSMVRTTQWGESE